MFWRFVEAHIRTTIVTAKSTSWAVNVLNNWIQYTCKAQTKASKSRSKYDLSGFTSEPGDQQFDVSSPGPQLLRNGGGHS